MYTSRNNNNMWNEKYSKRVKVNDKQTNRIVKSTIGRNYHSVYYEREQNIIIIYPVKLLLKVH
jgi:hypothetical protein